MKKTWIMLCIIIGIIYCVSLSYAEVPHVINYQGRFTDSNDNPLSGNYLVTFRFYDIDSGGNPIWEEGHILPVQNGVFNALLGSIKPLKIDFNKDLWLGIELASDGEMTPRIKLASSAYALNAQSIDMIDSSQLLRNDVDAVLSGSLTIKKDLILNSDRSGQSRLIFTDGKGGQNYIWVDTSGNLRLKQGLPASDKDGTVIGQKGSTAGISARFFQSASLIISIVAILIVILILFSIKKK